MSKTEVTTSRFLQTIHSGEVLLMDGAMGTQLQCAGIAKGECYELWNLTHADKVRAIHQAYVDAGARCLLTNTFQANLKALGKRDLAHKLDSICSAAVSLARSAAGPDRFVLGDIGPILNGSAEFADEADLSAVLAGLAGADAILLETWSDPAALQAARWCGQAQALPVILSLAYLREPDGTLRTRSGHAPEWFAERAGDAGLSALGVNCGRDIGLDDVVAIIRRYRAVTSLPLLARPNAGTPTKIDRRWVYPLTPAAMATRLAHLLQAGAMLIGGCCGTTPEHVAALRSVILGASGSAWASS